MKTTHPENITPVQAGDRHVILDALRGFALFGICLANFPEFFLYSFLKGDATSAMPTAGLDRIIRYLQYILIDGKFYTIFSLLFGIGFSIILSNAVRKQANGLRIFYRRMGILMIIGFLHLMFLWSGDILMLYALLGLLLPLFRNVSNRTLLFLSASLLVFPIVADAVIAVTGLELSAPAIRAQQHFCAEYGITDDNFAYWLRDAGSYTDVLRFLVQGAFVRIQEFLDGNRFFKVMGLFLLGFYIGRNRLYSHLEGRKPLLKKVLTYGSLLGLPASTIYAWSALNGHPWGLVGHSALYTCGVYPLALAYVAGICLWYLHHRESRILGILAVPGQMALTNYIWQSVSGVVLFYGIGFGLGADTGLAVVMVIAMGVYLVESVFSRIWLRYCRFGPLEWIWRMLTYGKWLSLMKET